jgi:hypothetical protein
MEPQPVVGLAYPLFAGDILDVSRQTKEACLVCSANDNCYNIISCFNIFPPPDLPLAGGSDLFDFVDENLDFASYQIEIQFFNRYAVKRVRVGNYSTIL